MFYQAFLILSWVCDPSQLGTTSFYRHLFYFSSDGFLFFCFALIFLTSFSFGFYKKRGRRASIFHEKVNMANTVAQNRLSEVGIVRVSKEAFEYFCNFHTSCSVQAFEMSIWNSSHVLPYMQVWTYAQKVWGKEKLNDMWNIRFMFHCKYCGEKNSDTFLATSDFLFSSIMWNVDLKHTCCHMQVWTYAQKVKN